MDHSAVLNHVNKYRNKHRVGDSHWDEDAASAARAWAKHLLASGKFEHGGQAGFGQNLFSAGGSSLDDDRTRWAKQATNAWYDEVRKYDFDHPGFSLETGHFTQLVWKGSKGVGYGVAQDGKRVVVVANYSPPGNVLGQFPGNVLCPDK